MNFFFLADLCESRLIPSRTSLKNWHASKLAELAYLYFLGLRILLANSDSKRWARDYCKETSENNDFATWRNSANDLYVMLFALTANDDDDKQEQKALGLLHITPSIVRSWLRHVATHDDEEETHRFFARLDAMFHITDSTMRSMRREVSDWGDIKKRDRDVLLTKLVQMIHTRAQSNSELLPQLKTLKNDDVTESASSGATGAGSIATAAGGLGTGFNPNGDWGVYEKKPIVIRRTDSK